MNKEARTAIANQLLTPPTNSVLIMIFRYLCLMHVFRESFWKSKESIPPPAQWGHVVVESSANSPQAVHYGTQSTHFAWRKNYSYALREL
jgi:hypothetical protein